jgi:hypothetical protein
VPNKTPHNAGNYIISSLFAEFGVKTEQELADKLSEESQFLVCGCCGKEVSIDKIKFVDGDPYCGRCFGNC